MAQLKKSDLIKILVEEYGYEKEDIKLFTNAKLQATIKQEEADAESFAVESTFEKASSQQFKDEDVIIIMSGASGAYTHKSRNGRVWKFREFGQKDKMPYGELLAIKNVAPKVLENGYIIVLNKDVAENLGLTQIYKNIIMPEQFDEVFKKSVEELETFVDALPEGMRIAFVSKARELYASRQLYDIRVVEMIQNKFGFSLEDNAPLGDIVVSYGNK